jgi:hypothetical protein
MLQQIRAEWGGECVINGFSSNSRGLMILFEPKLNVKIIKVTPDSLGNYLIAEIEVDGQPICLGNVYGPNEENPGFYEEFFQEMRLISCPSKIIGGDWNFVRDFTLDTVGYTRLNNPRARESVEKHTEQLELVEPFRILYPIKRCF